MQRPCFTATSRSFQIFQKHKQEGAVKKQPLLFRVEITLSDFMDGRDKAMETAVSILKEQFGNAVAR